MCCVVKVPLSLSLSSSLSLTSWCAKEEAMAEGPQLVLSTSGPFSCLFGDLLKIVLVHTEFNYDLQPQASGLQKQNPIYLVGME